MGGDNAADDTGDDSMDVRDGVVRGSGTEREARAAVGARVDDAEQGLVAHVVGLAADTTVEAGLAPGPGPGPVVVVVGGGGTTSAAALAATDLLL